MAWRCSGATNDEMVNNMKRFGVIHTQAVEDGFRAVDRRFFVPRNQQQVAHTDQPLKEGNVHISAPHMYGSILEALELHPNSSQSFLNLGVGTGYLSCIVAHILGPTSSNYGVEINADVVEHARNAIGAWKAAREQQALGQQEAQDELLEDNTDNDHNNEVSNRGASAATANIHLIYGNALNIDTTVGECQVGFDRIYVGASVEKRSLRKLASLLRPGGVLVGPVDDELVKVVKIGNGSGTTGAPSSSTSRSINSLGSSSSLRGHQHHHRSVGTPALSDDYTHQVLSGVRFAPLVQNPVLPAVIRSQVWDPSLHAYYPNSFKRSCKEILLCSAAAYHQPPPQPAPVARQVDRVNCAAQLPRALWMEILSYTHRDWFEPPRSEEEFLRRRVLEEQQAATRAQQARLDAETRLHMAERERDVYRLLALRWQSRLQAMMNEQRNHNNNNNLGSSNNRGDLDEDSLVVDDITQAASVVFANEPVMLRLGGLGAMIRRFQQDSDDDEEDDDEEDAGNHHALMLEDEDEDDEDEEEMEEDVAAMVEEDATNEPESMAVSPATSGIDASLAAVRTNQVRAVSITSGDL